jgi:DNA-binding transcriptional LysR family regulator
MELRHLRYFVAVAEENNFTRAAERLGIKQPPLSLQIRQLEKEMGTPLFRRLQRGIELTGAGKLFLEQARVILRQLEQAKVDVRRRARGETGQIRLGAAGACYFHPLVVLIASQFIELYPDLILSAEEDSTPTLIARVLAGQTDAAFVRSTTAECDGLQVEPIVVEDLVVAMPERTARHYTPPISLMFLSKETIILPPRRINIGIYDSIMLACQHAGFEPRLSREAPGMVATIPFVAAGCGVSIVPQCLSRLQLQGVAYLPIKGRLPTVPINLAYRLNDDSPAVKNLVALVRRSVAATSQMKKTA